MFVFLADEPRKFINGKRGQTLCFSMYAYHYVYRFSVGCCFFLYHGFPRTYQLKKELTPTFFYCFYKNVRQGNIPKIPNRVGGNDKNITMGLLNNLMDKFKNAEFTVAPNKKLKTISSDFKKTFDLTLVFYKGSQIADGDMTLAALNKKTTKEVNAKADGLKIKASMKVGDAEKLFDSNFGVTVQIKDKAGSKLVPNGITIGQAARGEY